MTTSTTTPKTDKKPAKPPSISIPLVKKDGVIDVVATLASAEVILRARIAEKGPYDAVIGKFVSDAFDKHRGVGLNANFLSSFVVSALKDSGEVAITPDSIGVVQKAVRDFVVANSSLTREDGKLFKSSGRGAGNGTKRWSDIPVTDEELSAGEEVSDEELDE